MFLHKVLLAAILLISTSVIAQLKKGQTAPPITLANVQDSSVSLSSFKGKVVLLDFWASWCPPCRASNRDLVKLYKEFKDQGFEIVAISVDQNRKAWQQAIKQDGLTYTQLLDPSGSGSGIAEAYGIYEIPTSYLIDKQGRLQERSLNINALKARIKTLLKD